MRTSFADRLNELIDHYRLNKNSLSVKLGFTSNTSITRLANHPDRNPSFEVIQSILEAFPICQQIGNREARAKGLNRSRKIIPIFGI